MAPNMQTSREAPACEARTASAGHGLRGHHNYYCSQPQICCSCHLAWRGSCSRRRACLAHRRYGFRRSRRWRHRGLHPLSPMMGKSSFLMDGRCGCRRLPSQPSVSARICSGSDTSSASTSQQLQNWPRVRAALASSLLAQKAPAHRHTDTDTQGVTLFRHCRARRKPRA